MIRRSSGWVWAAVAGILVFYAALSVGAVRWPRGALAVFFDPAARDIFLHIRLPRVLLGGAVGALLAGAGCSLQGWLRNPLADPYLLGVSGGAALGSAGAILLGAPPAAFALGGAFAALAAVLWLGRGGTAPDATLMILAGAALHAFTASVLAFLLSQARRADGAGLLFWLLGSLDSPAWGRLGPLLVLSAAALFGLVALAPALNLLALGPDNARSLGLDVDKARWAAVLLSAAAAGLAVTLNGVIPFVGLVVPHAARLLVGSDHRVSLVASAFLGAVLVVGADALGRGLLAPQEIPVGVVTALIGAPFFLVLLRRERRRLE